VLLLGETCGQPAENMTVPEPMDQKGPGHQGCGGLAGENTSFQLCRAIPSSLVLMADVSYFLYFMVFQVLSGCEMSCSQQTLLIAREDLGLALETPAKDSLQIPSWAVPSA